MVSLEKRGRRGGKDERNTQANREHYHRNDNIASH